MKNRAMSIPRTTPCTRVILWTMVLGLASIQWAYGQAPPPVGNQGTTLAVLPIEGERLSREAQRMTEELRAAARVNPAFSDHGSVSFRLPEVKISFDCFDAAPECMARVGRTMNAGLIVWGQITQSTTSIRLKLHAVNVKDGELYHEASFYFPDAQSVDENALGVARAFLERRPFTIAKKYSVRLETRPAGAQVTINDEVKGNTPITVRLDDGRHRIRLSLEGHETVTRNFSPMKPMERMVIRLEQSPEVIPAALRMDDSPEEIAPAKTAGQSRWPLWTGLALGAASLATGAVSTYYWVRNYELSDEQREALAAPDAGTAASIALQEKRQDEHDTAKTLMFTFGALGGVFAAGSVYFLFVHERIFDEGQKTSVSVGPGQVLFNATW